MTRNCHDCPSDKTQSERLKRARLELIGLSKRTVHFGKSLTVAALAHYHLAVLAGNGIIRAQTWRGGKPL